MTLKDACLVIGVKEDTPMAEVKTKYRQLMHKYHPDSVSGNAGNAPVCDEKMAVLINEAYTVLSQRRTVSYQKEKTKTSPDGSFNNTGWKAPVVKTAFAEREILQPVEDVNGNRYANICVARGKFVWTVDEEFSLFMLSIYNLSKHLLDKEDMKLRRSEPDNRMGYQAELAYLLARQFINGTEAMKFILGEGSKDDDGLTVYSVQGMLERIPGTRYPGRSEFLYPEKVSGHKLYLKNSSGKSIGYLSFKDNRFYYVIIPLFEERRAQVMIMQNPELCGKNNNTDLIVWVKLLKDNANSIDIDYNIKIQRLLTLYSEQP